MSEINDLDGAAAEYALGALEAVERAELDALRRDDPRVDAAIVAWESLLAPLALTAPDIEPPPGLFSRIEGRVAEIERSSRPRRPAFARRGTLLVLMALAACLVLALGLGQRLRAPGPSLTAELRPTAGAVAFFLDLSPDGRVVTARPSQVAAAPGKSFELWSIARGEAPHAIGLLRTDAPSAFPTADAASARAATWAVTVEPPGGSLSGRPTGPIAFSGQFEKS